MRVRRAVENDVEELAQLMVALHSEMMSFEPLKTMRKDALDYARLKMRRFVSDKERVVFVAEEKRWEKEKKGGIIGYVSGKIERRERIFGACEYGYVADLYVVPVLRKKGIAVLLMGAIEQFFIEKKMRYVDLQVLSGNADALRFYEKQGWSEYRKNLRKVLG